jgi:hypothetical protein
MVQTVAQQAGMLESLEAIKLKGLKIISLSGLQASQHPALLDYELSAISYELKPLFRLLCKLF